MKISFIIPVYNVEPYLSYCIESILAQTFSNFEVVLVDDGSPDGCPKICDQFALNNEKVIALHKPNGGLSDARNYGLKHCHGDYVVFVDGDDFWKDKDDLFKLVKLVEEYPELDFVGYNCDYYYPNTNTYTPWVSYSDLLTKASDKNTVVYELVKSGTFPMSACLKLIKRDFLIDNGLFFEKGLLAEDIPWFINVLDATNKCMFVNQYVYAYRQNVTGSITNTGGIRSFNNLFNIFKSELEKIDNRTFNDKAKSAIKSFLAYEYCILLTFQNLDRATFSKLTKYKSVLDNTINPKVKKISIIYHCFGLRVTRLALMAFQKFRKKQ